MATRRQDPQPSSDEQSGSTGRRTDPKDLGKDKDTGQGRYGQTGHGGEVNRETAGQKRYQNSGDQPGSKSDSNEGSGTSEDESERGKTKPKSTHP